MEAAVCGTHFGGGTGAASKNAATPAQRPAPGLSRRARREEDWQRPGIKQGQLGVRERALRALAASLTAERQAPPGGIKDELWRVCQTYFLGALRNAKIRLPAIKASRRISGIGDLEDDSEASELEDEKSALATDSAPKALSELSAEAEMREAESAM